MPQPFLFLILMVIDLACGARAFFEGLYWLHGAQLVLEGVACWLFWFLAGVLLGCPASGMLYDRGADCFVSAHPNAGLPNEFGGYDESAAAMATHIGEWAESGLVNIVGGCCGTTPEHIRALRDAVDSAETRMPPQPATPAAWARHPTNGFALAPLRPAPGSCRLSHHLVPTCVTQPQNTPAAPSCTL